MWPSRSVSASAAHPKLFLASELQPQSSLARAVRERVCGCVEESAFDALLRVDNLQFESTNTSESACFDCAIAIAVALFTYL